MEPKIENSHNKNEEVSARAIRLGDEIFAGKSYEEIDKRLFEKRTELAGELKDTSAYNFAPVYGCVNKEGKFISQVI